MKCSIECNSKISPVRPSQSQGASLSQWEGVQPSLSSAVGQLEMPTLESPPRAGQGQRYSPEDDLLLQKLKKIKSLSWATIQTFFPGRSFDSVINRYWRISRNTSSSQSEGALLSQQLQGTVLS